MTIFKRSARKVVVVLAGFFGSGFGKGIRFHYITVTYTAGIGIRANAAVFFIAGAEHASTNN